MAGNRKSSGMRSAVKVSSGAILGCCAVFFSACTQSSSTQAQAWNVVAVSSPAQHSVVKRVIAPNIRTTLKHIARTGTVSKHPFMAGTGRSVVAYAVVVKAPTVRKTPDGIVLSAPHALPGIVRIELPQRSVTPGELVRASVYTTSNTASVEARIYSYSMPLQRVGVGHFRFVYRVPDVPFYLKRDWPVQVIAHNVDGRSTSKEVTISIQ